LAHGPATIVVALSVEAAPFVKRLGLRRDRTVEGLARYRDEGNRIVLLQAGMGARGVARAVASLGTPSVLLSAGFCGGLGPGVDLGDLVIASQVIRHAESFPADPFLLETATAATKAIGFPFHVGALLTVDEIMTAGDAACRRGDGPIVAVDMESAYLAEAAEWRGIPFLAIRVVSDTVAEPWARRGSTFLGSDGRIKPLAVGAALLRHPSWTVPMLHLASRLRIATRRLTRATAALLQELRP
jgi:adenosylhomocysteine nucleosidase